MRDDMICFLYQQMDSDRPTHRSSLGPHLRENTSAFLRATSVPAIGPLQGATISQPTEKKALFVCVLLN